MSQNQYDPKRDDRYIRQGVVFLGFGLGALIWGAVAWFFFHPPIILVLLFAITGGLVHAWIRNREVTKRFRKLDEEFENRRK